MLKMRNGRYERRWYDTHHWHVTTITNNRTMQYNNTNISRNIFCFAVFDGFHFFSSSRNLWFWCTSRFWLFYNLLRHRWRESQITKSQKTEITSKTLISWARKKIKTIIWKSKTKNIPRNILIIWYHYNLLITTIY